LLKIQSGLANDNDFYYKINRINGVVEKIFIFNRCELYFLWEKFSDTRCAQFLTATEETINDFKKWLKGSD
jgi:hypothetical protein